jgi:hypothetical protein
MANIPKKDLPTPIETSEALRVVNPALVERWKNAQKELLPVETCGGTEKNVRIKQDKTLGVALHQTTGFALKASAMHVLLQAVNVVDDRNKTNEQAATIAAQMLAEMQPSNAIEGMLCSQMIAVHNLSMNAALNATRGTNSVQVEDNLKTMVKFSGLFTRQVEALAKLRNGGKQEVQVTHIQQNVQVNDGGQALVAGTGGGVA